MTNKEHLATLPSAEWYCRVDWLYHNYSKSFTNSYYAVTQWLDKEYEPVKPIKPNDPDYPFVLCPVCYTPVNYGDSKCCKCLTDIFWDKEK